MKHINLLQFLQAYLVVLIFLLLHDLHYLQLLASVDDVVVKLERKIIHLKNKFVKYHLVSS